MPVPPVAEEEIAIVVVHDIKDEGEAVTIKAGGAVIATVGDVVVQFLKSVTVAK